MNPEIVKFYADKQLHISKLIARRPSDVTSEQVEMAAEKVYSEVKAGYRIKTINIARHVWRVARTLNADAYVEEQKLLQNHKEELDRVYKIINARNATIKEYNSNIRRLNTVLLWYSSIAAALAVGLVIQEVLCIL